MSGSGQVNPLDKPVIPPIQQGNFVSTFYVNSPQSSLPGTRTTGTQPSVHQSQKPSNQQPPMGPSNGPTDQDKVDEMFGHGVKPTLIKTGQAKDVDHRPAPRIQEHVDRLKEKSKELEKKAPANPRGHASPASVNSGNKAAILAEFDPCCQSTDHQSTVHSTTTETRKEDKPLKHILILGKTGDGKSSLGNLILGKNEFKVGKGMSGTTSQVESKDVEIGSCILRIYDTPDLKENPQRRKEMEVLARHSFDLILYTFRANDHISQEEQKLYLEMKSIFGAAFTKNLVLAVTFGDTLQGNIDDLFNTPALEKVLLDARGRRIVFTNSFSSDKREKALGQVKAFLSGSKEASDRYGYVMVNTSDAMESESSSLRTQPPTRTPPPRPQPPAAATPRDPPCVLVIGKTGNGKSSVCNLLLGEKRFKEGRGMSSTTTTAQCGESTLRKGYEIKVVDTPDVSAMDEASRKREFERWPDMTSRKPSAIILVIRCDVRYTPEEYAIYCQLKELFPKDFLTSRLILAFTFGDRQDNPIEKDLKGVGPELQDVLKDAQKRFVVFNKKGTEQKIMESVVTLHSIVDSLRHAGQATAQAEGGGRVPSAQTAPTRKPLFGKSTIV